MSNDYWIPPTKRELVIWIQRQYWNAGQTCAGIEQFPKKRLLAIYFELIRRIKKPELAEQL